MYKPRKPNDVPYFTTEIVATSSSSSSPAKKPSGSAAKKHVASCKPGFQPSAAAHSMAVSISFRVIPRIWYCGVVVVISRNLNMDRRRHQQAHDCVAELDRAPLLRH